MRAVQLTEIGSLRVTDLPDPAPGEGEVLIRVTSSGMCGSDRHLVAGYFPISLPVVLGHEFEGIVVGGDVGEGLNVGDRVTVDPNVHCGFCDACRRGLVGHCSRMSAYGVVRDGAFAELVKVESKQVHVLPPDLPDHFGALTEPLSCCLRAMDHANIQPGQTVAVVGGGVMGQLLVQLASLAGATQVILSTRQRTRRDLAESLGATASVEPSEAAAAIAGPLGIVPGGVDVVFEAAGVAGTLEQSLSLVRRGGTVVVVGAAATDLRAEVSPFQIFGRELTIVGSHLNPFTHARAAQLVASGRLELAPLITRVIGLDDLPDALLGEPENGEIKVVVAP